MKHISTEIINFHKQIVKDENHRYLSWEHCYKYFTQSSPDRDMEKACLHLAFYLASWGMYRGSSFLLWKDYLIHEEVVGLLLEYKHLQTIDFSQVEPAELEEIEALKQRIKDLYKKKIKHVNGDKRDVNVTETLATKILLGTLGCIPAYDRYFIDGLRIVKNRLPDSKLTPRNFLAVVEFYQAHKPEFDHAQRAIKNCRGPAYPAMKLVDMYFWQIGFENDPTLEKK